MTVDDALVLASSTLRAELDRTTGALRRLTLLATGWELVPPGAAGLGFSLRIPLDGRRNNVAESGEQDAPEWRGADGLLVARWRTLRSQHGGEHEIGVEVTVRAVLERLVFTLTVDNRSELEVEDVFFPRIDGLRAPKPGQDLSAFTYRYSAGRRRPLWPTFENVPGYYGVDVPTYLNEGEGTVGAPVAPFILLETGEQGLYVGADQPSSELVAWHAELRPGYGDSLLRTAVATGTPAPEDAGVRFGAAHLPYVAPGEQRTLTPVALAGYEGDWHQGADLYVARRRTWMGTAVPPAWAREPHSWLQLHVNSPEDELRMSFTDLPEVARSCAQHGVAVIQLVGWNTGGQDRNNPSHDADERLGGPDALRNAIAECQAEGVRVVLFTKFTWADRSTELFRTELVHDAVKDPYGDYYVHPGYRYQTVSQLLDVSTRRLVPMCFASPHYAQLAERHFAGVLELGADGMLFDESLHHSPALLCFDESHGHRRGHPVYADDRALIDRFRDVAGGHDAQFLYAGEACYDWEFQAYELSYHRSEDPDHIPLSRYLRPEAVLMTAVTGFDDRNMVNQALMHRYLLSYEPYNFKGRLEDFPSTVAYGQAMDALRIELQEWLWEAEFRDTCGATVTLEDGRPHPAYSVFERRDGQGNAVVVCNYGASDPISVAVAVDKGPIELAFRTVDNPTWRPVKRHVVVPPRSAAVVLPASVALPA